MKNLFTHTPEGVKDIYDGEYLKKKALSDKLFNTILEFGYMPISTPTFEYFDTFSREVGTTPSKDLFKFFDRAGDTLVLRPDFTPAMARAAAMYFNEDTACTKLCYNGNVFINHHSLQGRLKESTQIGAELIGESSINADCEILSMAINGLLSAGLEDFIISIGHVDVLHGLLDATDLSSDDKHEILNLIENKNFFGMKDRLAELGVNDELIELFWLFNKMYSAPSDFALLRDKANNYPLVDKAIEYLENLYEELDKAKLASYVRIEPAVVSKYSYYTGIVFSGYTYGSGEPVVKGGRYDNLVKYFGPDVPAIGFAFYADNILQSFEKQKDGYLMIALGKGRLANKTMDLFEKMGISCEEMKDKNTRKLIFTNEEHKLKFFLAKGPDVPTYVEYGAADIGVVGEDTILEENRDILEVLDLGFGKCRMCVCGPASAAELLKHHELIRIATKYPRIAQNYFREVKHQTVEMIKLNGSIELSPIVGLSDVIVDIVETGSTLRENGLTVLEEVCPLSARVVVNQVSMKLEYDRITEIISNLAASIKE